MDIDEYLPQEIIVEILSRLAVKSLMRFRSVSKSWYFLITDPSFIKKHLSEAKKHDNLSLKKVILSNFSLEVISCSLSFLSNSPIREIEKISPLEKMYGQVLVLGVCDGLFCISIRKEMFLWNPSIRECKKVPSPPNDIPRDIHNSCYGIAVFAFGYDCYKQDYKVVRIIKYPDGRTDTILYSLIADSWRIIQDHSPYSYRTKSSAKFVDGSFHWLVDRGQDSGVSYSIVSFKLSNEKYGEVPLVPDDSIMLKSEEKRIDLSVLGGKLCLHFNYFRSNSFVLWVMKDYGVEKSWTPMLRIQYHNILNDYLSARSCTHIVPKYLLENGEMLLQATMDDRRTIIATCKQNDVPNERKIACGFFRFREIHVYEQSLVSPSGKNRASTNNFNFRRS